MSTTPPPDQTSPIDRLLTKLRMNRAHAALIGGVIGLVLTVLGFVLPFTPANFGKLTGGLEKWRENPGLLVTVIACHVIGLLLLFLSLQLLRGQERRSQNVRRLIYGFNAVFGTILLLDVLGLVNLLAYADPVDQATGRVMSREFDWTQDRLYTLSPQSLRFFANLQEPVKAYVMMPSEIIGGSDTQALLRNIQTRTNKVTWELLSPRSTAPEVRTRVQDLMKRYVIKDPLGVLLIVGDEKGKHDHDFVPFDKLVRMEGRNRDNYSFEGEGAILGALTSLVEGNVVIYVAEGHGELALDSAPRMPGMPRPKGGGLGTLKDRLTANRNRFEMKPLKIDRSLTKVPEDASALIIARPREPFQERELAVLRDYLSRKEERHPDGKLKVASGRLFLLFDLITESQGGSVKVIRTGLEDFARSYGVNVGDDRVQMLAGNDPRSVIAIVNGESPTPLGAAFTNDMHIQRFLFENARSVSPLDKDGKGSAKADPLVIVPRQFGVWAETDLSRDPLARKQLMLDDEKLLRATVSPTSLPIAVSVSESSGGGMPRDAAHMPALKERPLMIVFGSASWVSDQGLAGAQGSPRFDLFSSCLSWLREQSDIGIKVEGKKRKDYDMNVPAAEQPRLMYLPLALMVLIVIALGTGVWVIRRR